MPNQQTLEALRDVVMPQAPQLWPPAIGWWLAALAAAAVSGLIAWYVVILPRRRQYKSIADEVDAVLKLQPRASVRALSILMRKVAILKFPRSQTAGLTGENWLEFLDRSGHTDQFTQGAGRVLAEAPYSLNSDFDIGALHRLCRQWVLTVMKESK